jgi:hypothetical protein
MSAVQQLQHKNFWHPGAGGGIGRECGSVRFRYHAHFVSQHS